MNTSLKKRCEALNLHDLLELREHLSVIISERTANVGKSPYRCSMLMRELAEIMGVGRIDYFSRETSQAWMRAIVAYQMFREGYKVTEIGDQMMKDHSSVSHMTKKMQDVFDMPHMYRDIVDIWNKFQNRLQDETIISRAN